MSTGSEKSKTLPSIPVTLDFEEFIDHLQAHAEDIPLNLEEMAVKLDVSLDHLHNHFQLLQKTFKLLRTIQEKQDKKTLSTQKTTSSKNKKTNMNPILKHKKKSKSMRDIELNMTQHQIELLSDFHMLAQKIQLPKSKCSMKFNQLIDQFPILFSESDTSLKTSQYGQYFAEQYQSFRKLNTIPKSINMNNVILRVIQDEK